ncbi:MAG: hypothetical protein HC810_05705 [Acaryochloridaceae cyanobacterium RL_2_7]|nr:hypothetical protein [Acaryochloridaceae cyanobacterium RL_2_7]
MLDGVSFSHSIFNVIPALASIYYLMILPVGLIYAAIPLGLGSLVVFFGLYFFVVRNDRVSHFIRFNTMQALLISILLFLVRLILGLLPAVGSLAFFVTALNTSVFLAILTVFIYSVIQCFRGQYADLPSISEAVYMQVP